MEDEHLPADSRRILRLAEKFHDKEYRDSYVAGHTRRFLARQMRKFRGTKSQSEFGELIDKQQTVVSRLEDPKYGKWTLQTLFDVAQRLNVAVIVRFVDFQTFLELSEDMTEAASKPQEYNQSEVDNFARFRVLASEMINQFMVYPVNQQIIAPFENTYFLDESGLNAAMSGSIVTNVNLYSALMHGSGSPMTGSSTSVTYPPILQSTKVLEAIEIPSEEQPEEPEDIKAEIPKPEVIAWLKEITHG
jgi:hypothetical protein